MHFLLVAEGRAFAAWRSHTVAERLHSAELAREIMAAWTKSARKHRKLQDSFHWVAARWSNRLLADAYCAWLDYAFTRAQARNKVLYPFVPSDAHLNLHPVNVQKPDIHYCHLFLAKCRDKH